MGVAATALVRDVKRRRTLTAGGPYQRPPARGAGGARCLELWSVSKTGALSSAVMACGTVPLALTGKPPYSNPPYSTGLGSAWDKCCRAAAGPALVIVVEGVRS
jgi:hypothetical protein